ncbi:hypothetical protein RFN66_03825 [Bacillus paralicheniformis]|uniref:hypothetical protein n=1 Tax=Bacillus paralicheniformis TaxID=1648923 RepID=UPI0007414904|nr:hypothetical protein [Bacillus paralicheniformis]KUL16236.1 hypothetical protein LI6934_17010 [Bacillus licheniformis LMG 6934]MED0807730.1 hypothetical protein [Bacillus paralicheniformis]TWJ81760.1 hypothetical protein CHCC5019_4255 [Bacillus paralicheniformis]WMW48128.1 hypothetical protein RFN66_03825 [Bacillus paralicheniformis]
MKFIELTDQHGTKFMLNTSKVENIRPLDKGCSVAINSNEHIRVQEDYTEVKALLKREKLLTSPSSMKILK